MPASPIEKTTKTTTRSSAVALSCLLFTVALTQIAFHWGPDGGSSGPGWRLLLRGWEGVSAGYPEWLANPLLLASWLCTLGRFPRVGTGCAALALGLMLLFPLRDSLTLPVSGSPVPLHPITPGPGYWLWLASGLAMAALPLMRTRR